MPEIIKSSDNKIVKLIRKVHDRKKTDELVYIEGSRIVEDCLMSGGKCSYLICSERKYSEAQTLASRYSLSESCLAVLEDNLFDRISATVNSQGISMICSAPLIRNELVITGHSDVFCVLDNVQDPGNVGTIIRMADAFAFTSVIITGGTADPFGEKALRASMGSAWHIPVIMYSDEISLVDELNSRNVTTLAMHLKGDSLDEAEISTPVAFFIGNEGKGLNSEVSAKCSRLIKIPMPGKAESLNAASAASIIGNELRKARG